MNAHVLGFFWDLTGGFGKHVTLDDFFAQMKSLHDKEFEFGGYSRLVYVGNSGNYITGLMLTAKNHKKFCELKRKGTSLKINVREAEKDSSLIDFNFFLIEKTTARGLYQYYHNSCNTKVFSRLCEKQFEKIAATKIADEIKAKGGTKACSDEDADKIRDKYDGDIICHLHVRKEKFNEIVQRMQKISIFDFTLATIEPEKAQWFRILSGVSRIIHHRLSFKRSATLGDRAKAIVAMINSGDANEAHVTGIDEDGLEKVISLINNPDSFGHWKFDDLASGMTFEPSNFAKSSFMKTLVTLAEKEKDFLTKKAK